MIAEAQAASAPSSSSDVLSALRDASAKTGSDFQYLLGTAMRESSLDTQAKSKASSATGLFQFIDQTWLGLVKRFGDRYGLGSFADAIQQNGNGHYTVASQPTKEAILALRKNPEFSALMAGEAAQQTKELLECALGRPVCGGELYAAHFLGEGGARQLIQLSERDPGARADLAFPQAADANHSVFYHADGTAKTVGEVYRGLIHLPTASQLPAAATPGLVATGGAGSQTSGFALSDLFHNTPSDPANDFSAANSVVAAWQRGPMLQTVSGAGWTNPGASALVAANTMPQSAFLMTPGVVEVLASLGQVGQAAVKRAA